MGYTMQRELPASPVWKREVYRTLDLALPENAGLADPLTPTDTRMNLFTLIFKLLADKKIPAYEYTLDGNEQLDNAHRADFKDVLDRYHVYYRRKVVAATKDTVFAIDNSDIPSAEVQSYYIKEVYYYDRNSSSFHTAVEAICPRLHRAGDFDLNTVTYPMFWIQVSDLTPYLNLVEIPVSEYNNAATVRLDAYFAMQMYKGDIYKTNNPGGKTLSQIAPTDSLMAQERARIEAQLNGVESALWHNQTVPATAADSTQAAAPKAADSKAQNRRAPAATTKQESTSAARPAAAPSAPKASVRRERR
jgi:gliding motility associated protien GldN